MRQLWKQAEHERALLAKITDQVDINASVGISVLELSELLQQVDNSKKTTWSNATQLSMLKSKKQRISQVIIISHIG